VTTRLVVGITGASGAIYGIRLLEVLREARELETHLVISPEGKRTIASETDWAVEEVEGLAARVYDDRDIGAAIASGSFRTAGMVIAPCGPDTVGAVAHSLAASLIARAADVTLKEGRRLVVLAREAPLHLGHLRALLALAEMGAVILPPLPAFYARPQTIDDLVNHTVGRALDHLGVPHTLVQEWTGTARPRRTSPPRAGG
jgi:polyprenyl P-hydroxybenzoate/phenylacrylic acid decarboxylase-like protein